MTFLKLLLNINLIFLTTANIVKIDEKTMIRYYEISHRILQNIHPLHYEVIIKFQNRSFFSGESNILINIASNITSIDLYFKYGCMDNSSILLENFMHTLTTVPRTCYCNRVSHICMLYFDNELPVGLYILKLKFTGYISNDENSNGFFITRYLEERDDKKYYKETFIAGDYQEATGLHWIFPCWDEIIYKASFSISIYHPRTSFALSNMPIVNTSHDADMMRTDFKTSPLMSPHLVAFMISELIHFSNNNKNIQMWCRDWQTALHLNFALNIAEAVTNYLKEVYFQNIKFIGVSKTDLVAIPGHRNEGLTNWGLIFYSEEAIIYDEESKSIQRMMEVAFLISRKVAHQWFGNMVSPFDLDHMWLNEGIATFLGLYAVNKVFPDFRMMDLFVVQIRHKCLHLETDNKMPPIAIEINNPNDIKLFSFFRYLKASAIFRMLHLTLTDEVFQSGLKRYLEGQLTNPGNLWDAMQSPASNSNYKYDITVQKLMDTWTKQSYYPVLRMARNYNSGSTIIWAEMRNVSERNEWIPLTYATQTHPNFNITYVQKWLSHKSFLYLPSINKNDWIIFNLQQIGYYRVMYDCENWRRIAKYLNSDEYSKIHVLNRAQIIDDAYHFLITKQLDFDIFKELTKYLLHDIDYIAWYPMFKIFEYMFNVFPHPRATFIKVYMRSIVCDLLKQIGYEDKPGEDVLIKSLREEAAEWACLLGDENCRRIAEQKLNNSLVNFTLHKVSKKWIHCGGLMTANSTTWLRQSYVTIPDKIVLKYLSCFKEPDKIWSHLQVIKSNVIISDDEYNNIIFTAIAYHANNDETLVSLFKIFEIIKPRSLSFFEIIKAIIKYMYTEKQFKMIKEFVEINEKDLIPSVQHEIERHMSEMENMIACFQSSAKSFDCSKSIMYFDKCIIE